jgi:HopA1 effector protein family
VTDHRDQVAQALRALTVVSPTSYAWFGRRSRPLPKEVTEALSADNARAYLINQLENELYRSFYTQGSPVPLAPAGVGPDRPDEAFVEGLSRANTGSGGWAAGWRVVREEGPHLVVVRNGLQVRVRASDCRSAGGGITAATMSLRRPKEQPATSPGFYTALGDSELSAGDGDVEVRVYFNVSAAGATPLMAVSTSLLNQARIPFSLKVVDRPGGFTRCDSAVLYLGHGGFEEVRESLSAIVSECAPYLRQDSPAFAKPLSRGVAIGEHRHSLGGSFGSSRCRLVAEGIVVAREEGKPRLLDRLDTVVRRFAESGLDIEAPYLAAPSTSDYVL